MKQLLSILTLFAVPLTSVAVNAGEKEDREDIRALFHQEQEGQRLGNDKWCGQHIGMIFTLFILPLRMMHHGTC